MDAKVILKELVKCNTIKDKENKKIMDYIENTLKEFGFKTEKREKFLIMYNKGICDLGFLGHTDTVEFTDGWNCEKFDITEKNGNLYGLGVCDMKSGIAGIIAAISEIDFTKCKKGIKLYFTYDEEIGFSGIKDIIKTKAKFPKLTIIGEPTNNEYIIGSKGLMEYRITFKGIKAHSSRADKGKSAIQEAIKFINELNKFYEQNIKIKENLNFEIPYTTMNIGTIQGGSAINSVPDECEILLDFRTVSKEDEIQIENEILRLQKIYDVRVEILNKLSAFINPTSYSNKTCNFITEASFFDGEKIILGAGPVTAHEKNEFIKKQSLEMLVNQYKEIIMKYCNFQDNFTF